MEENVLIQQIVAGWMCTTFLISVFSKHPNALLLISVAFHKGIPLFLKFKIILKNDFCVQ